MSLGLPNLTRLKRHLIEIAPESGIIGPPAHYVLIKLIVEGSDTRIITKGFQMMEDCLEEDWISTSSST